MVIQTIKCVKDYSMVGIVIKVGTILTENKSKESRGTTVFTSRNKDDFYFDNSEILFSKQFHESFKLVIK